MIDGKTKLIIAQALVIVALAGVLIKSCGRAQTGSVIPSQDAIVSTHTVTPSAPLQALDKKSLQEHGIDVPKAVLKDPAKEVLATGKQETDSGSVTVAAVLDTKTGDTALIEKRPFWELMNRQEIGAGVGMTNDGFGRQVFYRSTFARMGAFYASGMIEAHDRPQTSAAWSAMLQISYRW